LNAPIQNIVAGGYLEGSIDDVRIYDRVLSNNEVSDIYDSEGGLIAYYPFNNSADDESANSNNLTINDAIISVDRFGNANSAVRFDGGGDYLISNDANILNSFDRGAISVWFYSVTDPNPVIFGYAADAGSLGFFLSIDDKITIGYKVPGSANAVRIDGFSSIVPNTWNHVVINNYGTGPIQIVLNNSVEPITFNANGTSADGTEWFSDLRDIGSVDHFINIGAHVHDGFSESHFTGIVDDLRIFNRALTSTEISNLYGLNNWPASAPSNATDITNFDITNQVGDEVISTENHTVALTMPTGTDRTAVTANITVSSGALEGADAGQL
jgi:hypothetical protein